MEAQLLLDVWQLLLNVLSDRIYLSAQSVSICSATKRNPIEE